MILDIGEQSAVSTKFQSLIRTSYISLSSKYALIISYGFLVACENWFIEKLFVVIKTLHVNPIYGQDQANKSWKKTVSTQRFHMNFRENSNTKTQSKMSTNIRVKRKCEYCKKEFTAKTIRTRYCSHQCNSRAYKKIKATEKIEGVKGALQMDPTGKLAP